MAEEIVVEGERIDTETGEVLENGGGTAVVTRKNQLARREMVGGLIRPVAQPEELFEAQEQTRKLLGSVLVKKRDYDRIPGTNKDTMLQPGAERSASAFGLAPEFEIIEQEVDHDRPVEWQKEKWVTSSDKKPDNWKELKAQGLGRNRQFDGQWKWQEKQIEKGTSLGLYRYVLRCKLVHRESGIPVGEGVGSASTMESKYIDRPRDLENTVLKMSKKRAYVDAVLTTLGLHDQFTQDVEDNPEAFGAGNGSGGRKRSSGNGSGGEQQEGPILDRLCRLKKYRENPKTWRQLATDDPGYVKWAVDNMRELSEAEKDELTEALTAAKAAKNKAKEKIMASDEQVTEVENLIENAPLTDEVLEAIRGEISGGLTANSAIRFIEHAKKAITESKKNGGEQGPLLDEEDSLPFD